MTTRDHVIKQFFSQNKSIKGDHAECVSKKKKNSGDEMTTKCWMLSDQGIEVSIITTKLQKKRKNFMKLRDQQSISKARMYSALL